MRELFPLPETPVMHVKVPSGRVKVTFFKLFPEAPESMSFFRDPLRRFLGILILFAPVRYLAVSDSEDKWADGGPSVTMRPPLTPAPGPISTR